MSVIIYQRVNRLRSTIIASYQKNDYEAHGFYHSFSRQTILPGFFPGLPVEGRGCLQEVKGTRYYWMKTISQFQCKTCWTLTTLRSGTVKESSKLSSMDWFRKIHLLTATKNGFSTLEDLRQIGRKRYAGLVYDAKNSHCDVFQGRTA